MIYQFAPKEKLENELKKCEIKCISCHRKHHNNFKIDLNKKCKAQRFNYQTYFLILITF